MDLDDFLEPEVAIAAAVTAALATPPVRRLLRQGLVYGVAGVLRAGDRLSALAQSTAQTVRERAGQIGEQAHQQPAPHVMGS
jgi:hypothetical protein